MASRADRAFEDAFALGRQNQVTVELARRHCLNMEFPEFGGRGMAEEVSGLPINRRRVHCPFGRPSGGASMNLEWLAIEFSETNCVGCEHRHPTGQLPNLASMVEERNRASAAAASAAEQESARRHAEWLGRVDRRRAMAAGADPAMASALSDVGLVDGDPLVEQDREAANDAVRRLEALAERAPEVFTADVASHIVGLVRERGATELLGPLRRLGSRAAVYRADVLGLALEILIDQPLVEAARCLVDLRDGLPPERLDQRVVEAMVMLAGGPERDAFGHRQASSARNDPAGLRLAADLAPDVVEDVLRRLLRTPPAASPLVVPAGTRPPMPDGAASDFERCAAAGAVRRLVATHPAIAGRLTAALARNLGVDDKNQYDDLYRRRRWRTAWQCSW